MKESVRNLKFAAFVLWDDENDTKEYRVVYDESDDGIINELEDIIIALKLKIYDEDETRDMIRYMNQKITEKSFEAIYWSNDTVGCECRSYAEGIDIAEKAADLLSEITKDSMDCEYYGYEYNEDDEDESDEYEEDYNERERIAEYARQNPDDYDAVMRLIDTIAEVIDSDNDESLF